MNIRFLTVARKELDKAVEWYNQQSPDLGMRFLGEVNVSLSRISEYPYSCAEIAPNIRRYLVNKFPYGVIYRPVEDEELIVIIAVAHLHRRPGYWQYRIS